MSDLESKKLDDSELENVNGGGFFTDLVFRGIDGARQSKYDTLLQKGDDDWNLDTLEQKKGFPDFKNNGFSNTSKL